MDELTGKLLATLKAIAGDGTSPTSLDEDVHAELLSRVRAVIAEAERSDDSQG